MHLIETASIDRATILDLVDEMQWEDLVEFVSLEEAGLEEAGRAPVFGMCDGDRSSDIGDYLTWFWDGEDSDIER